METGKIDLSESSVVKYLDKVSSKPFVRHLIYSGAVIFFFAIILIPPILGIFLKWNTIGQVFQDPSLISRASSAIYASFGIAFLVAFLDLVAGLPLAWFVARGKSEWLAMIDTLADIPFIIPTVTLGYSVLLFWSKPGGISQLFGGNPLVSPGWILVVLLHFAFSYPAVVRVIAGAIFDYKLVYEEAARTLGAAPLTADRTVTLPILKASLIAGFTLAFARSLSETGATVMVAGTFENGPIFINNTKALGQQGPLVFVSFILIVTASLVYLAIRLLGPRLKMPVKKVWPTVEKRLSSSEVKTYREIVTSAVFLIFVLIPSLFIVLPVVSAVLGGTLNQAIAGVGVWHGYWQSLFLSYFVATVVTVLNALLSLPMAVLIARKRWGTWASTTLDVLSNIPLVVPSIALGASMSIFWKNFPFVPEVMLIILAHLSITYPYFVRTMVGAIERVPIDLEEASRTLGGRPLTVFRTIILPLTKYSLFAGTVMMFARSVDETGATLAVVTNLKTIPVLLVAWVKGQVPATPMDIALGAGFLILFSFIILLALRLVVRGRY
jgi:thiamine transport system permease protein